MVGPRFPFFQKKQKFLRVVTRPLYRKLASDYKFIEHLLTIMCSLSNVKKCQLIVSDFLVWFIDFFVVAIGASEVCVFMLIMLM
ncbi:hypothetical protein SAMN03159473_04435 [Pseudomonas sp. NFACC52]|nr:hypothetical protein SAMN03159481_05142 [Pseudomonas sp. NFACC56-3]SFK88888.1 hypothetical protein SAMN03159473_04435 [Pseudomonas sp. NFACC52]